MFLSTFALCWTPVLLLALLAIVFRRPALDLAVCGTAFTLGLVVFSFHTPFNVALLCGFDGILTTLPLVLVIFAGILLSSLLMAMGSLQRIVDWLMGGVRNGFHRSLVITLGVGNFTEGAGVIAEPLVAPMLRAAGVEPPGAAALSIVGYAGLMTLEMAGIVITVLALVTGIPIADLGTASAWLSIPATLAMALCIPLFLPRPLPEPRQWLLLVLCGLLVGFAALAAVTWLAVSISGMAAGLVLILALMLIGSRRLNLRSGILRDLAPLLFILGALLALNTVSPLKELTFHKLSVGVHLIPVHTVVFRPLFSAYLYLFLAFLLATRLFHIGPQQLKALLATGLQRGWRPSLAMGLFGAMGQMIAYSGYTDGFTRLDTAANIPWIMANGLAFYTEGLYPLFVPLLGWVGTFLTGYGVASLMLFGKLQVETAAVMGLNATWLASGLGVGASLGSISSPFKIAIATPMCDAVGLEGRILRLTIPLGLAASLFVGVFLLITA